LAVQQVAEGVFDIVAVQGLASHSPSCHGQRLCLIALAEMGLVHAFSVFDFQSRAWPKANYLKLPNWHNI
jgi:hypothetical protein